MLHHDRLLFAAADNTAQAVPIFLMSEKEFTVWREAAPAAHKRWAETRRFEAGTGEVLILPSAEGTIEAVLFGLGVAMPGGLGSRLLGSLPFALPEGVYRLETSLSGGDLERAALGWLLGSYNFTRYKKPRRAAATLIAPDVVDAARLEILAAGMCLARDLINTPAEDMGPSELEAALRALAGEAGARIETIEGDALLEQNYPMIHRVGRAADDAPRLIDLRWQGPSGGGKPFKVTLVGKGVCFDTGGLDIKPSASMLLMKKDMGGAAVASALATMIMRAKLPVELRLLVPAVENSVSANSFRPGDVIPSRKGLTVENRNTDAEGRLVLGDALTEAATEEPDLLVDFATLTGAARVALGADLPAMFAGNDALAQAIETAGVKTGDPIWRMPLWDGYDGDLGSSVADITNAPAGGLGGAITAALFLRRFVSDPSRWVHFDVFGWTPKPRPGRPEGAECHAALALFHVIEQRAKAAA